MTASPATHCSEVTDATDVAIVLGAAVHEGGIASPALRRRASEGARLVCEGRAKVLIGSGAIGRFPPSEASVIRDIALEHGVPPEQIVLEESSTSTLENAIYCARILREKGWSSALIVTDAYHLMRAVFLFRRLGIDARPGPSVRRGQGTPRLRWYYMHLRELLALPWAVIRLYMYLWRAKGP